MILFEFTILRTGHKKQSLFVIASTYDRAVKEIDEYYNIKSNELVPADNTIEILKHELKGECNLNDKGKIFEPKG